MKPYVIRRTRYHYNSSPRTTLVQSPDGPYAARFATAAEARAYIAQQDSSIYFLSHNEYGRPTYKVARADRLPAYLANYL